MPRGHKGIYLWKVKKKKKTYNKFKLSIGNSPPVESRLFCPNDWLVHDFDENGEEICRIASAKEREGVVRDRWGPIGTSVVVEWRIEVDQLRAELAEPGDVVNRFSIEVCNGRAALQGPKRARARVIGRVRGEKPAGFDVFIVINKEDQSVFEILDVRLVFEFAGSEDENGEVTEEGKDLKTHLADLVNDWDVLVILRDRWVREQKDD